MEVEDVNNCDNESGNASPSSSSSALFEDEDFINWFIKTVINDSPNVYARFTQYINKYGQDIVTRNCNTFSIVYKYSDIADIRTAEYVLNNENLEYSSPYHISPFLYAVIRNNVDIVKHLIKYNGAKLEDECCLDIETKGRLVHGLCALTIAVSLKYFPIVEVLLAAGANVDHSTESLSTPLRIACHTQDIEMIQLLIRYNANPNLTNVFDHTPLMLSAFIGDMRSIKILIEHGADINHQAKCGATALHFAAQEGRLVVVSLLLTLGAELKKDGSGHTPLLAAALNSEFKIVHTFLRFPKLTTFQEKIAALELLAASYVTTFSDNFDTENIYHFMSCAFFLRYRGSENSECECTCCYVDDNLTEEQARQIPIYPKTVLEPLNTYEYHQESQTLEQLRSIQFNERKLFLECLVTLERILGPKSLHLADILMRCGAVLVDNFESIAGNKLWLRALRIKIDARIFIGIDFFHFAKLVEKMSRFRQPYTEMLKQGLSLAIDYYTARPRPYGYRELLFPPPIEEFTFNNHKHINSSISSKSHSENLDPKRDSDIVIYLILFLVSHVARNFKTYSENDQESFRKLTYWLCRSNITESRTGRTLLHLSLSNDDYINLIQRNNLFKFPNVELAIFLVTCGADVTATDMLHNTPLHYLAQFCMKDTSARFDDHISLLENMIRCRVSKLNLLPEFHENIPNQRKLPLFYAGEVNAHHDAVNVFGKTAFQMNRNVLTNIILNQFRIVPKLKCLAARMVHKKYLEHNSFKFTLKNPLPLRHSCENFRSYVTNSLPSDFIGYESDVQYFMHNFEQIDLNMQNQEVSLKLMFHYSKKLRLSLELVQFVEMHGPCKFAHI